MINSGEEIMTDMKDKSMRGLLWSTAIGACLLASTASAAIIRCDGCSESAYEQKAVAAGLGEHVVYDLANDRAVGFSVEFDRELRRQFVFPIDVPPEIRAQVIAFSAFFKDTGGSMIQTVEVSADELQLLGLGGASAFDVVGDSNLRARMADRIWLSPPSSVPAALRNVIETLLAGTMTFLGITTNPRFTVVFIDGSKVSFVIDFVKQKASYDPGSGRTASGQVIPESTAASEAGTWTFGQGSAGASDDIGQFIDHLRSLGIPVTGGGTKRIKCTFDGVTLSCEST
ncbi:MAG: hypothetical protein CVV12_08065 [Gammaproteobacteria bacterium HGW-Gammaproteobacteria-2]|jgi:hypothetical protein|nr:MAG: hypothetical protein CVV12_08065 [Gammaproteobacteria bacterium HGW-Gammaproteobacteria-2]